MQLHEIQGLVDDVAAAAPTDRKAQIALLERINAVRDVMRQGEQRDLVAYLEIASTLTEALAGGKLSPERIGRMVSRLVKQVANTYNNLPVDDVASLVEETENEPAAAESAGASLRMAHDQCLGEILVHMGALTREQVEEGVRAQRATGVRIGEALVMLGAVTWDQIESAVALQSRLRDTMERTVSAPTLRLSGE